MLILFIHFLQSIGIKFPAVFAYVSTRIMLAALTAFLFTLLLAPKVIAKLRALKMGQPILSEIKDLHGKKSGTPTMGGVLILASILLSLFLWMDLSSSYTLLLLIATIWIGSVGGYDDYLKLRHNKNGGLSPRKKIVFLLLFASLASLYLLAPQVQEFFAFGKWFAPLSGKLQGNGMDILEGEAFNRAYFIPFYKNPLFICSGFGLFFAFLMHNLVIVGSANSVNLTDGLDGLASGCTVLAAGALGIFAFLSNNQSIASYLQIVYIEGSGEIAIFLAAVAGAALGFLFYNAHPAEVFMGDTGSLALGGLLGLCAVLLRREMVLFIAGGVFVMEALSVVIQVASYRYRNKKRVFLCAPLHHHFEYKGWKETKVVIRFWLINIILAIIAIASLKFQ